MDEVVCSVHDSKQADVGPALAAVNMNT